MWPLVWLLALQASAISTQDTETLDPRPTPASDDTLGSPDASTTDGFNPTAASLPTASLPPASMPSPSSASSGTGDDGHSDGLLNYYFLLLAIFIILIFIIYYVVNRRRRSNQMQSRLLQRSALSQDLYNRSTPPWPPGESGNNGRSRRWRPYIGSRNGTFRTEHEGLEVSAEAPPPPYVKEPDRVHLGSRDDDVELGEWDRQRSSKPPDYEEHEARRPG